jgi:hypothetical protein
VRHSPLTLWHLLSLDAPTVAALWTWFVARCCGINLPWTAPTAMFLAVWILYASDRLLDARTPQALEERHHFHDRHRRIFTIVIALSAIALAVLALGIPPTALRIYALLAALLCGWFLMIHTRLAHERRLPKELAVGLFFSAAIFVPTVARRPDLRLSLLVPAAIFAAVCALNCMYLYEWEHPHDHTHANWTTRLIAGHLTGVAVVILTIALFTVILCQALSFPSTPPTSVAAMRSRNAIPAACAVSTILLLTLNRFRTRLSPLNLRAAADLALLTPILFLR